MTIYLPICLPTYIYISLYVCIVSEWWCTLCCDHEGLAWIGIDITDESTKKTLAICLKESDLTPLLIALYEASRYNNIGDFFTSKGTIYNALLCSILRLSVLLLSVRRLRPNATEWSIQAAPCDTEIAVLQISYRLSENWYAIWLTDTAIRNTFVQSPSLLCSALSALLCRLLLLPRHTYPSSVHAARRRNEPRSVLLRDIFPG